MAEKKTKKETKAKTPKAAKAPKAAPVTETVDAPAKASSIRMRNSGL